jgi:NDP-sugar pyrophosphorylase family protein
MSEPHVTMAPSAAAGMHRTPSLADRDRRERRRTSAFGEYRAADETTNASGIVLAGVPGWGGGAFERLLRGPLLPVAQEPLVSYPLRWLRAGGVRSAAVCAGSATSAVRERFGGGASLNMSLQYYEDLTPRGPAGCARDAALATTAERFVVVEGAFIPTLDLRALLAAHRASGAAATTVVEYDRRRNLMRDAQPGRPGGIYVFERHVLERVPAAGFQDIKQGLLERLYAHGEKVAVHEVAGLSPRVLDFHSYASVSSWLITSAVSRRAAAREQEMVGTALESLWLDGAADDLTVIDAPLAKELGAWRGAPRVESAVDGRSFVPFGEWEQIEDALVHPTATVHPSARLIGPVLVGPYACVEADAVIVGPTSIGAGAVIESDAVVARSELLARVRVGSGAQVDGSVVADGVIVAPQRHVAGAVLTGPTRIPSASLAAPTPPTSNGTSRSTPVSPLTSVSRLPAASTAAATEAARRPAPPITLSPLHTPPS